MGDHFGVHNGSLVEPRLNADCSDTEFGQF